MNPDHLTDLDEAVDLILARTCGPLRIGAPLGLGGYAREMFALAKSWGRQEQDCTAMLLLLEDVANLDRQAARSGHE